MDAHNYTVRLIHCSKKRAFRLEKVLILKHNPRDNRNKYEQYELDKWDARICNEYIEVVMDKDIEDFVSGVLEPVERACDF